MLIVNDDKRRKEHELFSRFSFQQMNSMNNLENNKEIKTNSYSKMQKEIKGLNPGLLQGDSKFKTYSRRFEFGVHSSPPQPQTRSDVLMRTLSAKQLCRSAATTSAKSPLQPTYVCMKDYVVIHSFKIANSCSGILLGCLVSLFLQTALDSGRNNELFRSSIRAYGSLTEHHQCMTVYCCYNRSCQVVVLIYRMMHTLSLTRLYH